MEYDVDVGPEMINTAFETNMIDDEWSIRSEREFTWWGYEQAQRVWADPPIRTEGVTDTKVHARTDVLRDVPDTEKTFHLVSLLNMTATLSPPDLRSRYRQGLLPQHGVSARTELLVGQPDLHALRLHAGR